MKMKNHNIRFALAVNRTNKFEAKHFGDVDKYLIYEYNNDVFTLVSVQINKFKNQDNEHNHGSKEKAKSIIEILKINGVKVLVSPQFGGNIKMINQHFIPIAIRNLDSENVFDILKKHMKWIIDELEINPPEYRLFSINTGILKSSIE